MQCLRTRCISTMQYKLNIEMDINVDDIQIDAIESDMKITNMNEVRYQNLLIT